MLVSLTSRPSKSPPMIETSLTRPLRSSVRRRESRMMVLSSMLEWWKQVSYGALT